ncbi:Npt1/Npt2 family nucleotide transporter [Polaribacter sp.]|uniref:Npt1/Npt2 family nucleotide transporter n=1 Tax=Polaribacter sp. TaxID=1920175 RepID=UPI003EF266F3
MSIIYTLKLFILKVFDLKEEELKKTLLLQLNIFIIITTLLIIKPTVNSLFLSELTSDALPLGYVLTAIFAIVGYHFYDRALEKYALNIIIDRTIMGSVISLILFAVAFNFNLAKDVLLFIPYVWIAIFGLLTASQFWILANLVYNVREAKRVFGFIGAGAIAGGIFGGYLTSLLTNFLETEDLLFVAAVLLLGCIPITRYIWKHEVVKLNPFQVSLRITPKGDSPIRLIKQSKLLSLIAVVIGISVLVAKLVDYQYSDYASRLITDQEELTSFFGFWFSTLSVISLLIQLFLTKRIVGTFGVGKSLLWLPSGILIGSVLLFLIPQLWVVVFIKIVDGSLKQSVNKAATELLSIPIPIEIKKKTKTFTDVVVDSIATGLAGFILIFLINGLDIPSIYISIIIIALIIIWLYFIYHLRRAYITAFKGLFEEKSNVKKEKSSSKVEVNITSIVDTVQRILTSGNEHQILHMLQKTLEVKDERFFVAIKNLLSHSSSKVKVLAIENLYFLKSENLCDSIESMVFDDNQEVTTTAFRYLVKHYKNNTVELFSTYLESEDKTIKNAALVGLSSELRNNVVLQNRFSLEQRIENALVEFNNMSSDIDRTYKMQAILDAIGYSRLERFYNVIRAELNSENVEIRKTAILSASKTLDKQFIDLIISHLSIKETRKQAVDALFFYGESMIDILFNKVKNELVDNEDVPFVVTTIEKYASQKAIKKLMQLTQGTEHLIKIEAIEAVKRLKWKYPYLVIKDRFIIDTILDECYLYQNTLSVIHSQIIIQYKKKNQNPETEENKARNALINLLEQRLDRQLERMFRLLGIKYPPKDIDPIFKTILNGKEAQRNHAIEFLDNILDKQLKKELIPVAESILFEMNSEEKIKKLNVKILSETECYHALLKRKDFKLKLSVLYLLEKTKNPTFNSLLQMVIQTDSNEKIKQRAEEISAIV